MLNYRIVFLIENGENDEMIELPVLPEKIAVKRSADNSEKTVLELGNVNLLKGAKLRQISFNSFFSVVKIPSVKVQKMHEPLWYVQKIQGLMKSKKPFQFVLIGTDLDINTQMSVESFEYSESYGNVGTLDYKLTLKEWVDYSPRKVTVQAKKAVVSSAARSGQLQGSPNDKAVKYTVKRGDCMWSICQQNYGNGNLYAKLYQANKEVMDKRNKGTGNPKYTIYVGEVLTLPPKEELK